MDYDGLLGGCRLFGGSLGGFIRWRYGFQNCGCLDRFRMVLVTGLTLVPVNVKGLGGGGGGGGRGAERTDAFKQVQI